jgi:glycerate dehydrogenase
VNIVVLDGFTLNPGDLSWEPLQRLGRVQVYDRTPPGRIVERALDAEIVLTNKTPLRKETLDKLPSLRYIGVLATGYDVVDIEAATARSIPVTNVPEYSTQSVAQFVFALLLELFNRVGLHADLVRAGEWSANPDFSMARSPLLELTGKTMGIVGPGRIGTQTARIAQAFGMNVIAWSRSGRPPAAPGIRLVDRERLFRESDVVSLHCPLTPETERMIDRNVLASMKPTAFLINTARGRLIAEADLADALNNGVIAGAGLDVLSVEPPTPDNPLLTARNCVITPHIAWASKEARQRLLATAVDNVRRFLEGQPQNVVNGVLAGGEHR